MIVIPKYKDTVVELQGPKATLEGKYKLKIIKPDGRVRLETDWFSNLILNTGLDFRMGGTGYFGSTMFTCCVGTGSSTPVATQTTLDAQVMSVAGSANYGVQASAPYYGFCTCSYQFSAAGSDYNLTEIGVGISGSQLTSRALIVDGVGNPTTISILTGEILEASYQLNIYPPLTDNVQTVTISGIPYSVTTRAVAVTSANPGWGIAAGAPLTWELGVTAFTSTATLGAITDSSPATCSVIGGNPTLTPGSYTNGTYTRSLTMYADINTFNHSGGIGAFTSYTGGTGQFQHVFSSPIPKDNTNALTLTFNYTVGAGTG